MQATKKLERTLTRHLALRVSSQCVETLFLYARGAYRIVEQARRAAARCIRFKLLWRAYTCCKLLPRSTTVR